MTRAKGLLVVAVLAVAVVLGTTAAPAHSTSRATWCNQYGESLPSHSLATSLICPGATTTSASRSAQGSTLNLQIAAAINNFRRAHGLPLLTISTGLNAAARQHSTEMGAKGYFDHNSADGTAWWKRIQHYCTSTSYSYWTVGENLLYASPTIGASAAMKLWIASPEHLANLMNRKWRNLGVSAVHVAAAGGVYDGNTVTIITTDFGARH